MYLKGVGPRKADMLKKLDIFTMYDFLTHYPRAYENYSTVSKIADVDAGETVVLVGRMYHLEQRVIRHNLSIIEGTLDDDTGRITVMWFNQDYLMRKLEYGTRMMIIGKIKWDDWRNELVVGQVINSTILGAHEQPSLGIMPVYPSTSSLPQSFFRTAMKNLLDKMPPLPEILPQVILKQLKLMPLDLAMHSIHFPKDQRYLDAARRRLAFDELFLIQCGLMLIKRQTKYNRLGIQHEKNGELVNKIFDSLPFELTNDQKNIFAEVSRDMEDKLPMRRLIQGDVGSGKTAVALLALVKAVQGGYQGAMMAPTEILANQHYEKFSKFLSPFGIRVGLLSAKVTRTKKMRDEIYKQISEHELDIVVGTHSLIQEGVRFAKLGLVVTDEQHRFGVVQRSVLEKRSVLIPDMLVMTATPIPRTMSLTVYGDLDVSLIKEMPPGRKPIETTFKSIRSRKRVYEFVREEILKGRQAYVVCPLISRSDSETLKHIDPVVEVYEMLSEGIFRDVPCDILHGKMKPKDKDEIMERFRAGETRLLVSTTVIEVGVDVPNATVMVVENADRFGLAQLHQLRGRVGRGSEKSYCILLSNNKTDHSQERMELLQSTNDGFKLAEEDLKMRGPGQFFGEAQHGLPDLKVADVFRDVETLIAARDAAEKFVTEEADLNYFVELRKNLALAYGDKFSQITRD